MKIMKRRKIRRKECDLSGDPSGSDTETSREICDLIGCPSGSEPETIGGLFD